MLKAPTGVRKGGLARSWSNDGSSGRLGFERVSPATVRVAGLT